MTKPFKLRRGEFCVIHSSYFCCGRERPKLTRHKKASRAKLGSKWIPAGRGVWRIDDPHHPRGYREKRSDAAIHTLVKLKILEQNGLCAYCHLEFTDSSEVVGAHKKPKGMGGARHDDHPDNIVAAHSSCNLKHGSQRMAA